MRVPSFEGFLRPETYLLPADISARQLVRIMAQGFKDEWQPGNRVVYLRNADYVPRSDKPSGAAGGKRRVVGAGRDQRLIARRRCRRDGRLVALDAATGHPLWDVVTVDRNKPYTITGAPRVAVTEMNTPRPSS